MRTNRLFVACIAWLVACSGPAKPTTTIGPTTGSAAPVTEAPKPPPTGDEAPLPMWPEVKTGKLANGLTYYVLRHKKPEKRALLWLAVNAGSLLEDDDQRGLAHFDEHMAFNGTARFPKDQIVKYLETIGMRFGADLNASTDPDETIYKLQVPTDDPQFIGKGLDILHDWAGSVTYDAAEVDKERGVVLEEWRLGRGAGMRLYDKTLKVLMKGSRYAERITIGLPEILKQAPRDTLYRYYKDWYRPNLMAVIAVGDFDDTATIEREIQQRFGDLKNPAKERPRVRGEVPKADGTRIAIETDHEMTSTVVRIYNVLPSRPRASVKDLRRILVENVYGEIMGERLNLLSRKPDAPFQGAGASTTGLNREVDAFVRSASAKQGRAEDALRVLSAEVLRAEKFGFLQSELDRARAIIGRAYEQSAVTEPTRSSGSFVSELLRHYFTGEFVIGASAERDYAAKLLPTITLGELNALASTYGGADNRVIVVNGPDGTPLPAKDRVVAILDEVGKTPLTAWEDKVANAKLLATTPTPGTIKKETHLDSTDITEWTLSNGIKVVVKPTDFELDAVSITGRSPGGVALANDRDYPNARFADDLAAVGGLGEFDADTLGKILAGKRAFAGASINETSETLSAGGSVRDLETIMQLLYLRATAPRKDDEAIGVWRANQREQLTNRLRSPDVQYNNAFEEAIWKGHLRRKPLLPADIDKIDPDKALAFYKERFSDFSDFTFIIVGAVDVAKLKPLVETYVASLPAKGRKEKEKDIGARRPTGVVTKTFAFGSEPKARVTQVYHGDETWTRDKDRDMYVLVHVLSMRLREVLREDLGGVYGVGANGFLGRSPRQEHVLSISYGCDPTRVDELIAATNKELAAIVKDGITADYLDKVKASYLRERETALRTNGRWVGWLTEAYRYGDDPALILDPNPLVNRMTSDNVKAAAKRYLDGKQLFTSILYPAGTKIDAPPPKKDAPQPQKEKKEKKDLPGTEAPPPGKKSLPGTESPPPKP